MQQLSPDELRQWQQAGKECLLIDVREAWEHAAYNIGGRLIPLGELMSAAENLARDQPLVFYCEKGIRSIIAIQRLEGAGFKNLYNLAGGMKAWRAASEQA